MTNEQYREVELCGACGEEPLTCGECGEAFCPCQRVDNPPDIGYLMQELERCESHVCMAAVRVVNAFELLSTGERDGLMAAGHTVRGKRAEMRKGGTWTARSSA